MRIEFFGYEIIIRVEVKKVPEETWSNKVTRRCVELDLDPGNNEHRLKVVNDLLQLED